MALIIDLPVTGKVWVDVNTVTGIAVGSAMELQNKGISSANIQESPTEPVTTTEGKFITTIKDENPVANVLTGSDRIWAFCNSLDGTTLAVQEI